MTLDVIAADDVCAALGHVLAAALDPHQADAGVIQLLEPDSQTLRIAAHHGSSECVLQRIARASEDDASSERRALRERRTTQIPDVRLDPEHATGEAVAADAGFRAAQSTPLIGATGGILGVLTVHVRQPHGFSERDRQLGDVLGHQAAELIAHHAAADGQRRTERALRRSELEYRTLFESIDEGFCTIEVLFDADDRPVDYRRAAEDALRESDRHKDEFLAMLAHELRNPLAPRAAGFDHHLIKPVDPDVLVRLVR